ncbi:MAG: SRPBCC domain-containing protein [Bacteroidia bacterium]|nr:SRPBCC domain-containing protein [Bacteroidia bacterium]
MKDTIKFTVEYNFPVEEVWQAIATKEAMSEWLMPCDFEPIVGRSFQFKSKPYPGFDGNIHCVVLELVENKLLSYSWTGGSLEDTRVRFQLQPKGGKTVLHFEHSGFNGFMNQLLVRRILSNGWKTKILPKLLLKFLKKNG